MEDPYAKQDREVLINLRDELAALRARNEALEGALREWLFWSRRTLKTANVRKETLDLLATSDPPGRVQSDSEQAMRDYARSDEGKAAIREGYEDYKAGRVHSAKEVFDEVASDSEPEVEA